MRIHLFLIVVALFGFASHARVIPEVEVTLIDYESLLRMTPEHRAYYLKEVREALMEFEKQTQPHRRVVSLNFDLLEQISQLALPQAYADTTSCSDGYSQLRNGQCYFVMPPQGVVISTQFSCTQYAQNGYRICSYDPSRGGTLPAMARAAYENQPVATAQAQQSLPAADSDATPVKSAVSRGIMLPSAEAGPSDHSVVSAPSAPAVPKTAVANPLSAPTQQQGGPSAIAPTAPIAAPGSSPPSVDTSKTTTPKSPANQNTATPKTNPDAWCKSKPTASTCDKKSRDAVRAKFYASKKPQCVYGGGVNAYQNDTPAVNKCAPTSTSTFGSDPLTCKTGQTVCNPMVFGVKPGSGKAEAFCAKADDNATSSCNDQSKANTYDVIQKQIQSHNVGDQWNKFKDQVKTLCASDKDNYAGQFHCAECDIMKTRLLNAAVAVKGEKPACDAMKEAGSLSPSPASPTNPGSSGGMTDVGYNF